MARKQLNKGFSVVEAVIILLVVATLSVGAWYIWRNNQAKPSDSSQNTVQKFDTGEQEQGHANPVVDKYISISEWGVRFTVPEGLRGDISYFMDDRAKEFSGADVVGILSKKFSEGSFKCADIEGGVPRSLVSIERQVDGQGGETVEPAPFKRFDNTRYYMSVTTPCEETVNREGSAADKKMIVDLKESVTQSLEKY